MNEGSEDRSSAACLSEANSMLSLVAHGGCGDVPGASRLDYSLQGPEHRQERLQESKDPTRSKGPPQPHPGHRVD